MRNGLPKRQKPRPKLLLKGGTRGAKREYQLYLRLLRGIDVPTSSMKDRILAAGYDAADINYIGISAVPGANVCKVLTEEGM